MARVYYGGAKTRVFSVTGDAIVMKQEDLISILDHLLEAFPNLEKVTTYAGPRSTLSKTPEQLAELRRHGLVRALPGVETAAMRCSIRSTRGSTPRRCWRPGPPGRRASICGLWC